MPTATPTPKPATITPVATSIPATPAPTVKPATPTPSPTPQPGSFAYVSNYNSSDISVVDLNKKQVIKTIDIGANPGRIVFSKDGTRAYVLCNMGHKDLDWVFHDLWGVAVVDLSSGNVLKKFRPLYALSASDVAVSPDGKTLYVLSHYQYGDVIWKYDAQTYTPLDAYFTSDVARIFVCPDGSKLYEVGTTVKVVSTATMSQQNEAPFTSFTDVAMSRDGRYLLAYYNKDHKVYWMDLQSYTVYDGYVMDSGSGTPLVTDSVIGMGLSPDGKNAALSTSILIMSYDTTTGAQEAGYLQPDYSGLGAVAIGNGAKEVYVANVPENKLLVMDMGTGDEKAAISVGETPTFIGLNDKAPPASNSPYVFLGGVSPISSAMPWVNTGSSAETLPGRPISAGTASPVDESGKLYAINEKTHAVSVFSGSTGDLIGEIAIPDSPMLDFSPITASPDGKFVYLAAPKMMNGTLYTIDTTTDKLVSTRDLGEMCPQDMEVSGDGRYLFVADIGPEHFVVYDLVANRTVQNVDNYPCTIAVGVNPVGGAIYTTEWLNTEIHVFDPISFQRVYGLNLSGSGGPFFNADGTRGYVLDAVDNSVAIIDTATFKTLYKDMIPVGREPTHMATNGNCSRLYVLNREDWSISVIDTATNAVIDTLNYKAIYPDAAEPPFSIAVNANGTRLYLDYYDRKLIVIDPVAARLVNSVSAPGLHEQIVMVYPRTMTPAAAVQVPATPTQKPASSGKQHNLPLQQSQASVSGAKVSVNWNSVEAAGNSSLSDMLTDGKLFLPLVSAEGDPIGEMVLAISAAKGSPHGNVTSLMLDVGKDGTLVGTNAMAWLMVELNGLPPQSSLDFSFPVPDDGLRSSIADALRRGGRQSIGDPLAVLEIGKVNLTNSRDVKSARIRFDLLRPASAGSSLQYSIVFQGDDGKVRLLDTTQTTGENGLTILEAPSPDGLGTYAVVKTASAPAASPEPTKSPGSLFGLLTILPLLVAGWALYRRRLKGKN